MRKFKVNNVRWVTFYISRRLSWLRAIVAPQGPFLLPVLSSATVPLEMLLLLESGESWSTDRRSESDVGSLFLPFRCLSSIPLYSSFCNVLGDMLSPTPCALSIPSSNLIFWLDMVLRAILEARDLETTDLTPTESSDTNDRKSFTEGGIFEKNKSLKFPNTPLLYGFSFLSYRYRKFSYVVCNRTNQQDIDEKTWNIWRVKSIRLWHITSCLNSWVTKTREMWENLEHVITSISLCINTSDN